MCGIVGYIGPRSCQDVLLGGLGRLEYRGYDSAGIAVIDSEGSLHARKRAGKLGVLRDNLTDAPMPDGHIGIGHTRWATHGGPTDENAHPHMIANKLAVVHNGIIENFSELKAELEADGVEFVSETDTEVAANLIARAFDECGDLEQAFRQVILRLDGAFTLVAMHVDQPDTIVAARLNSPLVIGVGDGETFLGSDVAAFVEHTHRAVAVGQEQVVVARAGSFTVTTFDGEPVELDTFEVSWDASAADKGGWPSFMAKEIAEEPEAVANTLRGRIVDDRVVLTELDALGADYFEGINRILVIGCGTAAYSGMVGCYAIEEWANLPASVELAHEFRYRKSVVDEHTLVISISQSGETMDTLMAVRHAQELGAKTLSICNTQGATIARESDAVLYTHAGPEVAVASTKAFLAQMTALYLFGLYLGQERGTLDERERVALLDEFQSIPEKIKQTLTCHERIHELANWMADTRSVLFLGRHVGYPVALEGALKLKEIAYIHAEGFAAGELKHGPIALIDHGQPVFVLVPSPRHDDSLHPKVVSNIQEIRARGARVLAICEQGDAAVLPFADEVIGTPPTIAVFEPLLHVVPLQIFALELSSAKGLDVDQPRNLAKAVTVE